MKEVRTTNAPQPVATYSQAIQSHNHLFISGQLGLDPKTNKMADDQTTQALNNLTAILTEAHLTWKNVVRVEIFLADLNDFTQVNAIYETFLEGPTKPARQAVQVARLPLDAQLEISAIAEF